MSHLDEYLAFARAHPRLFENPPGAVFTILLDPTDIERAEAETAERLNARGLPREWASVGIAFRDQYLRLLRDAVRRPDGALGTYVRFLESEGEAPGVVVLPVYQGQILLLRHFRHATRTWHLEVPRGFGEPGLSPEENVRKELDEEIKAVLRRVVSLGPVYPDSGISAGYVELFFAELESFGLLDSEEGIDEWHLLTTREVEELIRTNALSDGFTLQAFLRAKVHDLLP